MIKKTYAQFAKHGGYIVILNVLFFLAISTALVTALVMPLVSASQAARGQLQSTQAFVVGNSAIEESLYRLNNNYDLPNSEVLALGFATATISVVSGANTRTIRVDTESNEFFRSFEIEASAGAGVNFNYGLQAGRGGFEMAGGAIINGNVYSNGNIIGNGGPIITGSAYVANRSNPEAHISHIGVIPHTSEVPFGGNTTPQDFAQSFQVTTTTPVTAVRFYMMRTTDGWMNNITMRLTTDNGGKPSKTLLDTTTIITTQLTTSYNYITVPFSNAVTLTPGVTYWIVLDTATTWGANYAIAAAPSGYVAGIGKTGSWTSSNGGTWADTSPAGLDAYFEMFVGGDTGLISGVLVGQNGGDAWAHEVTNSTIQGALYCQASSNTNKPCDTSRPDPAEQPFPVSEGNIADWKAEAEAGGTIVGNVSYGNKDEATIGPVKIQGNLSLNAGAIVDIVGTLYVTGDITISGGAILRLASSYGTGSGVIVSDGLISMTGGGVVEGSGLPGSYVLVLTTSSCGSGLCGSADAITVSGGTDSVILNAQKGSVNFTGGATANQVTAHTVIMSGGTVVNYISGLADVDFSSGPSGAWSIDSWQEI